MEKNGNEENGIHQAAMMVYKNLQKESTPALAVDNNSFISTLGNQVLLLLAHPNKPYIYIVASIPPYTNNKGNGRY